MAKYITLTQLNLVALNNLHNQKAFEPNNRIIMQETKHKIKFLDAGPANAIFIISSLGFERLTGFTEQVLHNQNLLIKALMNQ